MTPLPHDTQDRVPPPDGPDDATHIKPDDLAATIYRSLGIDHTQELQTRTGRPVYLVPHGSVVGGIFA